MRKKLPVIFSVLVLFAFLIFYKCAGLVSSQSADARFQAFTENLFRQELATNTLNLHYTLKEPETYQIEPADVSLGSYQIVGTETCASVENCLAALQNIPYAQLSSENQLTYDILTSYLTEALKGAPYTLYEEPLSPLTGTQAQLPVLLSEYPFYQTEDVETYLQLLEEFPAYFDSLIAFEQAKSDADLFMPAYAADSVVEECQSFIDLGSSNYLYSSFQNRLEGITSLEPSAKDDYIRQNQTLIETAVFPSYQRLIDAIANLRDTGVNGNGICYYPDGTSYYEYLVRQQTGSDRSIAELKELTLGQMQDDLQAIQDIINKSNSLETIPFTLDDSNPLAILHDLKAQMADDFPEAPEVTTQIKFVQSEMEEYLSPAFYMVPAIDNYETNVIYINQGHLPDDLDLFTTLAHEGYPGHLYQTTYFASTNPDPIRSILNFGGYTEGWATYCEMASYYYTSLSKEQASLLQHNASMTLGLYALADIGIHYEGWTLIDTVSFFRQYGITDTDTITSIFELIIGDPANYLKYYIGYVEFLELKKDALREWGEYFTQKDFHKMILDTGPAPFSILKEQCDKYVPLH